MAGRSALAALKSIPENALENMKTPVETASSGVRDAKQLPAITKAALQAAFGRVDDSLPDVDDLGRRRN
ncbi:hypothetical protein [Halorubellus sp. PRR65]|uniref:hypothetical protein n=1 Tax=Halorubellus sp. PRR65 TaxID=3098148 RepID=UPI002B25DEB7|nr:hypothetical protein [Halorubellus sp. PRR65]